MTPVKGVHRHLYKIVLCDQIHRNAWVYACICAHRRQCLNKHRSGHIYIKMFVHRLVEHMQECVHAPSMPSPGLGERSMFHSSCPAWKAAWALQGSAWFWVNRKLLCLSRPSFLSLQKSPYKVFSPCPQEPELQYCSILKFQFSLLPKCMHIPCAHEVSLKGSKQRWQEKARSS